MSAWLRDSFVGHGCSSAKLRHGRLRIGRRRQFDIDGPWIVPEMARCQTNCTRNENLSKGDHRGVHGSFDDRPCQAGSVRRYDSAAYAGCQSANQTSVAIDSHTGQLRHIDV